MAVRTRVTDHARQIMARGGPFRFVERREGSRAEHAQYVEIVRHAGQFSLALIIARVLTRVRVEIEPRETGCKLRSA
jgi:hypothetical protein